MTVACLDIGIPCQLTHVFAARMEDKVARLHALHMAVRDASCRSLETNNNNNNLRNWLRAMGQIDNLQRTENEDGSKHTRI